MFASGHAVDCRDERSPPFLLRRQHLPAGGRDPIEAPPARAGLLHPPPVNPSAFFQAVEERIERSGVKLEFPARPQLDQLRDVVPVPGLVLHQRQNQQLGAAFLELTTTRWDWHMWESYIT